MECALDALQRAEGTGASEDSLQALLREALGQTLLAQGASQGAEAQKYAGEAKRIFNSVGTAGDGPSEL